MIKKKKKQRKATNKLKKKKKESAVESAYKGSKIYGIGLTSIREL